MEQKSLQKINILGIEYASASLDEIARECMGFTLSRQSRTVVTPNAEIAYRAYRDEAFMRVLRSADIAVPDGIGVILAAKRAGTPLKGRVPGVELAAALLNALDASGGSLYLFGAAEGVAAAAAENIKSKHPNIRIAGTKCGFFEDGAKAAADISQSSPDVLFVCLGSPKQEEWMARQRGSLSCGVMLGLGGTMDILAGRVKRAPAFFRKTGCEWLYRLITQPSRIKRMWKLPRYVLLAKKQKRKEAAVNE